MLRTLNLPRNRVKGPWSAMSLQAQIDKLAEERGEVDEELIRRHTLPGVDWHRLRSELVDEAVCSMILIDRCCAEIKKGGCNGRSLHKGKGSEISRDV